MGVDQGRRAVDIVIGGDHRRDRHVQRVVGGGEGQQAAMVATGEAEHGRAPGHHPRGLHREHVGLGAGIAEPHPFERGEAVGEQRRHLAFERGMSAVVPAEIELRLDGAPNRRMVVPIDSGRRLAEEVGAAMAVLVPEICALPPRPGDGERIDEDPRPRIPPGHAPPRPLVHLPAARAHRRILRLRLLERRPDIRIDQRCPAHPIPQPIAPSPSRGRRAITFPLSRQQDRELTPPPPTPRSPPASAAPPPLSPARWPPVAGSPP